MALFGSSNHILGRDAQEELFEAIWPGLDSDHTNRNLDSHRNRCHGKVSDALLAALVDDEICAWTDHEGDESSEEIRVPRAYWDTDRAKFYFYNGDIETGEETKSEAWSDLESYYRRPWYLLRTDFEQFKWRLQNGGPAQYVSLPDALHYVAAGGANAAAVMRWECEIHRSCGHDLLHEKYKQKHSALLEVALSKIHSAWQAGIVRPIGRLRRTDSTLDDYVPQEQAQICEFLPLGSGEGSRIEPKDAIDHNKPDYSWYHVKFLRRDIEMLLPATPVADPMSETHWTVPQCLAWVAARNAASVARATSHDGLQALGGAWSVTGKGYMDAKAEVLREFRKGLTCLARARISGNPGNVPMEERAHINFDVEHNAALIDGDLRWHDLRFPVADVLRAWPPAGSAEQADQDVTAKATNRMSEAKVKRWLKDYRASLNGKGPDPQSVLRAKAATALECELGEKWFRKVLKELDESREDEQPALVLERGKKAQRKSAR